MPNKSNMNLKTGWHRVKFGDVVRQCKVKADPETSGLERYIAGDHMNTDDLRLRRWGEIGSGYLGPAFHMRFKPGQVLYGSRRTYLRKVAIADFEGICANTTFVLESKNPDQLLPEFLPFIMQTHAFNEFSIKNSKGSVNPYINFSDLALFEFALPPLMEQERLLDLFIASNEVIESYREAAKTIGTARQAFLASSFPEDPLCPENVSTSATVRRLDELADVRMGLALGKKHGDKDLVCRPYLRVANVLDGALDLSEVKTVEVRQDELERYELREGDVLMTEGGDFDKLGRGTVWQGQVEGCLHQNHVFAVRPDTSLLLPAYLAAMARSPYGKRYFLSCAKKTSNLASINKRQLSNFPVLWVPLNVQTQVIVQVAGYDQAEQKLYERLASASELASVLLKSVLESKP